MCITTKLIPKFSIYTVDYPYSIPYYIHIPNKTRHKSMTQPQLTCPYQVLNPQHVNTSTQIDYYDHDIRGSSCLRRVQYLPRLELLMCTFFGSKATYTYLGVEFETYKSLLEAESIGQEYNRIIRDKFTEIRNN